LKILQLGRKRSVHKVVVKESMVVEENSTTEKKPGTLHQDNRKDALRTSQELELAGIHPLQDQGDEGLNQLKDLTLKTVL
jgi:hypothetical protein